MSIIKTLFPDAVLRVDGIAYQVIYFVVIVVIAIGDIFSKTVILVVVIYQVLE